MAYEGEVLTYSPANLDFSVVYAVIVSGTFVNPCGHALLPLRRLPSPEEGSGCIDIGMSKSRLEASLFGPKNGVHLIHPGCQRGESLEAGGTRTGSRL